MYAYVQGKKFTKAEVPEDLQAKREKLQARVEKKVEEADKPKKVDKGALAKKIQAQLHGIDLLEKLTCDLVQARHRQHERQDGDRDRRAGQAVGQRLSPGAQAALHSYTKLFAGDDGRFADGGQTGQRELVFSEGLDQLGRLHALVKQGRSYLQRRLEDPDLKPETDTPSPPGWGTPGSSGN